MNNDLVADSAETRNRSVQPLGDASRMASLNSYAFDDGGFEREFSEGVLGLLLWEANIRNASLKAMGHFWRYRQRSVLLQSGSWGEIHRRQGCPRRQWFLSLRSFTWSAILVR